MTFEEKFTKLLVEKLKLKTDLPVNISIELDDLSADLLEDENWPSIRGYEFWDKAEHYVKRGLPSNNPFECENVENILRVVQLASQIGPDKWGEEFDPTHGLYLHTDTKEDSILPSRDKDGNKSAFYAYNGEAGLTQSIAFMDLRHPLPPRGGNQFKEGDDNIQAVFCLVALENLEQWLDGGTIIVSSINEKEEARTLLQYHLVLSGCSWTRPVTLPSASLEKIHELRSSIGNSRDLIQFKDPFSMLSNINASTGILEVFMSAYHALENYMIRSQVAKNFSSQTNLTLNRVRDFKRLGTRIDQSESNFLSELFCDCWDQKIGNNSLAETADQYRRTFLSKHSSDSTIVDDLFQRLDIKTGKAKTPLTLAELDSGNSEQFCKKLAQLVYAIRCSVVHNKATEFHLSNENLSQEEKWQELISDLCIPIMLQLVFGLPTVTSSDNPIRYQSREIRLY